MKNPLNHIAVFLALGIWSCDDQPQNSHSISYVEQAFDSIQGYSIHHDTYHFDSLKKVVLEIVANADKNTTIRRELEIAIKAIDPHSYVLTREEFENLESGQNPATEENPFPFRGKLLNDSYAYISLDGFTGVDSTASVNYADSLQRLVLQLYDLNPDGWIIDLRSNSGGWVYPMIAGLGPILGEGVKAYEIDRKGVAEEFYFAKSDTDYLRLVDSVYYLPEDIPVAVLIGRETASAGELLTLCFRGNSKTTLIGEATYGAATGLKGFFMPDSVQFAITHSIMTDRNKVGDGGPIQPTVIAENALEAFECAYEWIEKNKQH